MKGLSIELRLQKVSMISIVNVIVVKYKGVCCALLSQNCPPRREVVPQTHAEILSWLLTLQILAEVLAYAKPWASL